MDSFKSLLDECMDNISMDDNVKNKILNMDINEKLRYDKASNKKVVTRKTWKNIVSVAACLVLIFTVTSGGIYALSGKTVFEVFFKESEPEYAKELMYYSGQTHIVDDYTITLEHSLYDAKTQIGYCVMSINKEGGKPESGDVTDSFGPEGRFVTRLDTGNRCISTYEYIGDTLYQYSWFSTDEPATAIRVLDYFNEVISEEEGYAYYDFSIEPTSNHKEYELKDNRIMYISSLGIVVDYTGDFSGDYWANAGIETIELHYNSGKVDKVIDFENEIGLGLSGLSTEDYQEYEYSFVFNEIVDINNVDYILINGEKYESVN